MKEFWVTTTGRGCLVELGVPRDRRLTPRLARRAARVAYGSEAGATVWDLEAEYGYRLYPSSARKVRLEEER